MALLKRKQTPQAGRRQPTTTDRRSSGVFSYHSNARPAAREGEPGTRVASGAPKGVKRTPVGPWWRRTWVRNLPSLIALLVVVASLLYCLGLTTNAQVNFAGAKNDEALSLRSKDEYQAGAEEILNDSIFNRTKFTINTQHFNEAFHAKFPEVADVAITIPLISRRPVVNISTAQPQLILQTNGQAYVLDMRGMAIMKAQDLPSETRSKLPQVQDQTGLQIEVGKGVLPTQDIAYITEVNRQFAAKGMQVEGVILPPRAHEIDIRLAGVPYTIKFSVDTNAREAVGTYLATRAELQKQNVTPAEYVDVRVEGRAYYK